ncbi:MAG: copper amine oxidase N-terminal domain-containing protein, partial [Clostridia bacterium]|nr:copper amine oxidase N-terminal domain-containing protein [Clostridia bacterium]
MRKKILLLVASLLFTVLSATTVFAANEITVNVNGEKVDFDVQPFIENDRVMIPLRGVTEKLGAEVEWDAQNKSAYIHKDTKRIICQVNNDNLYENIGILAIDVAPKIVNGRIFIPLRAVSESLDCNVQWDAATQTVNISENTLPFTVEYKTDTIRTEIPEADVTMIINYTYPKITDGKDFLTEEMVSKANEYAKKMRTEAFDADEYIRTTILTPTTVTENRRDENGHCDLEINIDQEVYASEKYGTVSFMTTYWDLWSGPAVTSATYNKDSFEKYRNYGAAIKIEPPT